MARYPNLDMLLNRGRNEKYGVVLQEWLEAYDEIGKKYHKKRIAKRFAKRMTTINKLAREMHSYDVRASMVDECFYGQWQSENSPNYGTAEEQGMLIGDFPCGNEADMYLTRNLFSIREMAYLQMGFAADLDPKDFSEVPRTKKFESGFKCWHHNNQELLSGRMGFIHECLGHIEEAIACYRAMKNCSEAQSRANLMEAELGKSADA